MNTQRVEGHTPKLPGRISSADYAALKEGDLYVEGNGKEIWIGAKGSMILVATMSELRIDAAEKAAQIAHAVNNIERLEKVNEALVRALEAFVNACEKAPPMELMAHIDAACVKSRAALALAKEPA